MKKLWSNKKGLESEVLVWWIVALVVFAIMIGGFIVLQNKGVDSIEFLKNLFRFRK